MGRLSWIDDAGDFAEARRRLPAMLVQQQGPPRHAPPWPRMSAADLAHRIEQARARAYPGREAVVVNETIRAFMEHRPLDETAVCAALNAAPTGDGQFPQALPKTGSSEKPVSPLGRRRGARRAYDSRESERLDCRRRCAIVDRRSGDDGRDADRPVLSAGARRSAVRSLRARNGHPPRFDR
jgi:hypothetical protein